MWGNSDYNFYSKFLPKMSLKKIGSPRHDNFFVDSKKKNDLKKTILITASPIIEWTGQQNINLELRYENFLKSIIDDLQKHKNFNIIVKLHPGWGWQFNYTLLKICKNIDPNIPIFSTESIVELIDRSDMIININAEENQPSTVILEALIMKKPVINISLDESNREFDYDGISPIISLSYKTDIMKYVIKLFDDSKFYEELTKKIIKSLNNYLSNHKNASKQLADYLKSYI
jgi:UDP-N-acetylglucosamine 2-epimerase